MSEKIEAKRSLEQVLKLEGVEFPPIHITFYFHQHEHRGSALRMRELVKKADVVCIEATQYGKTIALFLDGVSNAPNKTLAQYRKGLVEKGMGNDYIFGYTDLLYKTGISVICPDVQAGNPILSRLLETHDRVLNVYKECVSERLTFEQAIDRYAELSREHGVAYREREHYIEENIKTELVALAKRRPELLKKKSIRILFPLGGTHTGIEHTFAREYPGTKRERVIAGGSVVHGYDNANARAVVFGKTLSRNDLEGGLIERLPSPAVWNLGETLPTHMKPTFIRIAVNLISSDERRHYYEQWMIDPIKAGTYFRNLIAERGIPNPISPKRLEAIVKRYIQTGRLPERTSKTP